MDDLELKMVYCEFKGELLNSLHLWRAYLAQYNKDKLFNNALQGKKINIKGVVYKWRHDLWGHWICDDKNLALNIVTINDGGQILPITCDTMYWRSLNSKCKCSLNKRWILK